MILFTQTLKNAGFDVRVTPSKVPGEHYIEIHAIHGAPLSDAVHKEIESRVSPELAGVLVEELAHKIASFQVLEAIRANENEAWRGLRRAANGEFDDDLARPRKTK